MAYFWNTIKILRNRWANTGRNKYVNPDKISDNIQSVINKVCPPWVLVDPTLNLMVFTNDFLDVSFDFRELNIAIDFVYLDSAPALDGVEYKLIFIHQM